MQRLVSLPGFQFMLLNNPQSGRHSWDIWQGAAFLSQAWHCRSEIIRSHHVWQQLASATIKCEGPTLPLARKVSCSAGQTDPHAKAKNRVADCTVAKRLQRYKPTMARLHPGTGITSVSAGPGMIAAASADQACIALTPLTSAMQSLQRHAANLRDAINQSR